MAEREPWERQNNPEPWERPDKPAPWLSRKKETDPWDQPDDSTSREAKPDSQAIQDLRSAEQNAVSPRREFRRDGQENNGKSFYTGKGKEATTKNKRSLKGKLKGKGAIITIVMVLAGMGTFLGASNSLLAPALEALFTNATDTQYASSVMRSSFLMKYYLGTDKPTTTNWRGATVYGKMSSSFQKRLSRQGIEIEGGGSNKTMVFTTKNDAGEDVVSRISAGEFESKFLNDVDFRDSYMKAKRGRIGNFFDNVANKIYGKLGLSRNLFANYQQKNDLDADTQAFKDTMSPKFEGNKTTMNVTNKEEYEVPKYDADGNPVGHYDRNGNFIQDMEIVTEYKPSSETATSTGSSIDGAEAGAKKMLDEVAGKVGTFGGWACNILRVGNMISMMVAANEIYQSINYFMGQMENVSKMKAGYGDESAIHSVLNFLTTPAETSTTNLGELKVNMGSSVEAEALNQNGAPVESEGMLMVLAGKQPNTQNTKVYSLERVGSSLFSAIAMNKYTALGCAGIDIATGTIELASSLLAISASVATGGLSTVVVSVLQKFKDIALGAMLSIAVSVALGFLIPTIAQVFFTNVFDTLAGIPAGEMFTKGASAANTTVGRKGSGQSISSKEAVVEYNKMNNTVLALDAEIDRHNLSPFDTTNQNTFFGSIAYSLLPTMISSKTTSISSFLRTAARSLSSLTSKVSADGEGSSYMTTFSETCLNLDNIEAAGDIYCNPIPTTDVDTIELTPDDPAYQKAINDSQEGCNEDGSGCQIVDDSDLARYITYCDGRESPFGAIDQNILAQMQPSDDLGTLGTVLNNIPVIGSIMNIVDSAADLKNLDWANGQKCGNTSVNSKFWSEKGQYYQRYVEDMRILEDRGAFEDGQNPVLALEERYETKLNEKYSQYDPIVAYYSRIAGLTPENTEIALAFLEYYDFVDQYDATTRIATEDATVTKTGEEIAAEMMQDVVNFADEENIARPIEDKIIAHTYIIYADVRNRSYAA